MAPDRKPEQAREKLSDQARPGNEPRKVKPMHTGDKEVVIPRNPKVSVNDTDKHFQHNGQDQRPGEQLHPLDLRNGELRWRVSLYPTKIGGPFHEGRVCRTPERSVRTQ